MSNKEHKSFKLPEKAEKQPFAVPEDYFSTLSARVNMKIMEESSYAKAPDISLWNRVRPHLALAAAIVAFALISITTLQFILGDNSEDDYYDLAMLDDAGILDEFVIQETYDYGEADEDVLTEWEEDAIRYLASNDMDLYLLLGEN